MARKQGPTPPPVPLELWRELYDASVQLQQLAPWRWMDSDHVFGINNQYGVRLITVMGSLGSVFGIATYPGTTGINFTLRLLSGLIEPVAEEAMFHQDALQLDLVPRKELRKEDLAVIKQIGFEPPPLRPKRFPKFSSYKPGYYPWFVNETEARMLLDDIRKTILVARLLESCPELFDPHGPDDFPFLGEQITEPLTPEQLEWHTMVPSEEVPFPPVDPRRFETEALAKLPHLAGEVWELVAFYSTIPVGESPRPYWPRIGLSVDSLSGRVMGMDLTGPPESLADAVANSLTKGIAELGLRPTTIQVDSSDLQVALHPLAQALGIKLHAVNSLPMAEEARESLEEFNRRG